MNPTEKVSEAIRLRTMASQAVIRVAETDGYVMIRIPKDDRQLPAALWRSLECAEFVMAPYGDGDVDDETAAALGIIEYLRDKLPGWEGR